MLVCIAACVVVCGSVFVHGSVCWSVWYVSVCGSVWQCMVVCAVSVW